LRILEVQSAKPVRADIAALQSKVVMRARVFRLLYLTAIAVAMLGWMWMLVEGFARAIN
jgi:hypothetical protein